VAGLTIVNKYAKLWKKEEKLSFVGGYLDGRIMDATETTKLAGLPSREVLLAKLLGSMMSPLSGLARFFDAARKDLESKNLTKVGDLTSSAPVKAEKTEATPAPVVEAPKTEEVSVAPAEVTPTSEVTQEVPAEVAVATPEATAEEITSEEAPKA
jgi:large subunit ribosomal protein L10